MAMIKWIKKRLIHRRVELKRQKRLSAAVEEVVDAVDPRMRSIPGHRRQLAHALQDAARFARRCVDTLPEPIIVARDRWGRDPQLRAYFASVDTMQEVFDTSPVVRQFLASAESSGAEEIYAAVGMRMDERTQLGYALQGDAVQRDVAQVAVSFGGYQIGVVAANRQDFYTQLQRRVLEELASRVMQQVLGKRTRKHALSEEQSVLRWKLKVHERRAAGLGTLSHRQASYDRLIRNVRQRLAATETDLDDLHAGTGTLEDLLRLTIDVLTHAERHIRIEPTVIYLDAMNIKHQKPAMGASTITLTQVYLGERLLPRIVQLVRFAPGFPKPDTGFMPRRAARALGG